MHLSEIPLSGRHEREVRVEGGEDIEQLHDGAELVGRLIRTRWPLEAVVTVSTRPGTDPRLVVAGLRVDNTTPWAAVDETGWTARDLAARHSLVGTHLLVTATRARCLSLLEGPDWTDTDTRSCRQERCWPVLVHDDDGHDAVLVAPIILGDHPTIAPESAGDLFDATEIDEILTLRVMTMTEQEKAEARGTDPRAAAILARCDTMSDEGMQLLHGARRPADAAPPVSEDQITEDEVPWWDAEQDSRAQPEQDVVLVAGTPVSKGSRVLLRPSRRADAQDLFLAGLVGIVTRVYFDVDGDTHVAVMLEDDPGSDLYSATGRFYYFGPEELEPLPAREVAR